MLVRAPWQAGPSDDWRTADNLAAAARLLPSLGTRFFLTTGIGGLDAFASVADAWYLVRLMEPAMAPLPLPRYEAVIGKPPYDHDEEHRLIAEHRIDAVVSKNSGGAATGAKLAAARDLGLPVVMVRRPDLPGGERVETVEAALGWLERRLQPPRGRST
jgi:precorrin-6A/cobalt-precorrin-6A reductase